MKKSYSIILALGMVLPGTAIANTTLRTEQPSKVDMSDWTCNNIKAFAPTKKKRPVTNIVERTAKEDGIKDLEGTWTFIVGDNYFSGSKGYTSIKFEATVDIKFVTFKSPTGEFFPIKAKYNAKSHSLLFFPTEVAIDGDHYVYQEPFVYDAETGIKKKSVTAYFNEYEQAIVFEDNLGLAWVAYGSRTDRNSLKGYYDVLDLSVCTLPQKEQWKEAGEAVFTDAWLAPVFGISEADATYEVPLQQNATNENMYRLVNPYKYGPLAVDNDAEEGYIVFDISNPEHVVFRLSDAGFSNAAFRSENFFVYNYMGSLMLINPFYTPEEVIHEFGNDFPASTYNSETGVVSLPFDRERGLADVRFALQDLPNSPRYWMDAESKPLQASASIALPGKSSGIGLVGQDAEIEYFNVQGMPVVNPEPGTIVIKRQGNVVTKEIVK